MLFFSQNFASIICCPAPVLISFLCFLFNLCYCFWFCVWFFSSSLPFRQDVLFIQLPLVFVLFFDWFLKDCAYLKLCPVLLHLTFSCQIGIQARHFSQYYNYCFIVLKVFKGVIKEVILITLVCDLFFLSCNLQVF